MDNELRKLRVSCNIPAKEMVEVVQGIYPKYDKTTQSKCENGDQYGVILRPDALTALYEKFQPGEIPSKRKKSGGHKLTCRISARLPDDLYSQLQLKIQSEGYQTMQDWLGEMIRQYIANDSKE